MSTTPQSQNPPPDIFAAIVAYLQGAMGGSLASSTGYPQVYDSYLPATNPDGSPTAYPYAVVAEGAETYTAQSEDPATGHYLSYLAAGTATVAFYAETLTQARALRREAVRKLSDSVATLVAADGRSITFYVPQSTPIPTSDSGVGKPTFFIRTVTVAYMQQFPE